MTTCHDSAISESLIGTAEHKKVYLVIEQPGTWGQDALLECSLPEGFGKNLKEQLDFPEVGIFLARRTDMAAQERRTTNRRRFWLAHTSPGGVRMRSGSLDNITDVLRWDWQAIIRGELPAVGRRSADPVLFLCTNGKKDQCCAVHTRKIVDQLRPNPELTGQIYEASHVGGHRFAPTGVLLPFGIMVGRMSAEGAQELLNDAWSGNINPDFMRGRTAHPPYAQIAEIEVRKFANIKQIDSLDVVVLRSGKPISASGLAKIAEGDVIQVRHSDGRSWNVELELSKTVSRKKLCTGDESVDETWLTKSISQIENWHF
jgi:hypothetical protein